MKLVLGQRHFFSYSNLTLFQAQRGICISQGPLVASNRRQLRLASWKGTILEERRVTQRMQRKRKERLTDPFWGRICNQSHCWLSHLWLRPWSRTDGFQLPCPLIRTQTLRSRYCLEKFPLFISLIKTLTKKGEWIPWGKIWVKFRERMDVLNGSHWSVLNWARPGGAEESSLGAFIHFFI